MRNLSVGRSHLIIFVLMIFSHFVMFPSLNRPLHVLAAVCSIPGGDSLTPVATFPFYLASDDDGGGSNISYQHNELCNWRFQCPSGMFVRAKLVNMNTSGVNDRLNYVDSVGTTIRTLSGIPLVSETFFVFTNHGPVEIDWQTDFSNDGPGWNLTLDCLSTRCANNITEASLNVNLLLNETREISNYAIWKDEERNITQLINGSNVTSVINVTREIAVVSQHLSNELCDYTITCPSNTFVSVTNVLVATGESSDLLSFINAVGSPVASYYGQMSGPSLSVIFTNNGPVHVKFVTGGSTAEGAGFKAQISCSPSLCTSPTSGEYTINATNGTSLQMSTDSDGEGPLNYLNGERCRWKVTCPVNTYAAISHLHGVVATGDSLKLLANGLIVKYRMDGNLTRWAGYRFLDNIGEVLFEPDNTGSSIGFRFNFECWSDTCHLTRRYNHTRLITSSPASLWPAPYNAFHYINEVCNFSLLCTNSENAVRIQKWISQMGAADDLTILDKEGEKTTFGEDHEFLTNGPINISFRTSVDSFEEPTGSLRLLFSCVTHECFHPNDTVNVTQLPVTWQSDEDGAGDADMYTNYNDCVYSALCLDTYFASYTTEGTLHPTDRLSVQSTDGYQQNYTQSFHQLQKYLPSNYAQVHFFSDHLLTSNGWELTVKCWKAKCFTNQTAAEMVVSWFPWRITGPYMKLIEPDDKWVVQPYQLDEYCQWTISCPAGYVIVVKHYAYDFPPLNDNVTLRGSDGLTMMLQGIGEGKDVFFSSSSMTVTMVTDDVVDTVLVKDIEGKYHPRMLTGFQLDGSCMLAQCSSNLTQPQIMSTFPFFIQSDKDGYNKGPHPRGAPTPISYYQNEKCSWRIDCPSGWFVYILHLDGETRGGDYVVIERPGRGNFLFHGTAEYTSPKTKEVLNWLSPMKQVLSGASVNVSFTSQFSLTDAGFDLRGSCLRSLCANNETGTPHITAFPFSLTITPAAFQECHWRISCPRNQSLRYSVWIKNFEGNANVSVEPTNSSSTLAKQYYTAVNSVNGYRFPTTILSFPDNDILVSFTDPTSYSGPSWLNIASFQLDGTCVRAKCSAQELWEGVMNDTHHAVIQSDMDGAESYAYWSNEECSWFLECPNVEMIIGYNISYALVTNRDYLEVSIQEFGQTYYRQSFTGTANRGPLFFPLLNASTRPVNYHPRLNVSFYSSTNSAGGFTLHAFCFHSQCSTNQTGTIRLTEFPTKIESDSDGVGANRYAANERCYWELECPVGSFLYFYPSHVIDSFSDQFRIELGNEVLYDSINASATHGEWTRSLFPFTVNNSVARVSFTTGTSVLSTGNALQGFTLWARCVVTECVSPQSWDDAANSTSSSSMFERNSFEGEIKTLHIDRSVTSNNDVCLWKLQCPISIQKVTFINMLGALHDDNDVVQLFDFEMKLMVETKGPFDSSQPNAQRFITKRSPNDVAYVKYLSGNNGTRSGGLSLYYSCNVTCNAQGWTKAPLTDSFGTIRTDKDGSGIAYYDNNEYCDWAIQCPNDESTVFTRIEGQSEQNRDFLRFGDQHNEIYASFTGYTVFKTTAVKGMLEEAANSGNPLLRMAGNMFIMPPGTTHVIFTSDFTGRGIGFTLEYMCVDFHVRSLPPPVPLDFTVVAGREILESILSSTKRRPLLQSSEQHLETPSSSLVSTLAPTTLVTAAVGNETGTVTSNATTTGPPALQAAPFNEGSNAPNTTDDISNMTAVLSYDPLSTIILNGVDEGNCSVLSLLFSSNIGRSNPQSFISLAYFILSNPAFFCNGSHLFIPLRSNAMYRIKTKEVVLVTLFIPTIIRSPSDKDKKRFLIAEENGNVWYTSAMEKPSNATVIGQFQFSVRDNEANVDGVDVTKKSVENLADVSSVMAISSQAPTVSAMAQRGNLLEKIATCIREGEDYKDSELEWADHPTQFTMVSTAYGQQVTAVFMNFVLLLGFIVLHYFIVLLVTRIVGRQNKTAVEEEDPSSMSSRAATTVTSTNFSAEEDPEKIAERTARQHKKFTFAEWKGILRFPSLVFFPYMFVLQLVFTLCVEVLSRNVDSIAPTSLELAILIPSMSVWILSLFAVVYMTHWVAVRLQFNEKEKDWKLRDYVTNEGGRKAFIVKQYRLVIDPYNGNGIYFFLVEIGFSILLGILEGLMPLTFSCATSSVIAFVLFLIYFVILCIVHPYRQQMDVVFFFVAGLLLIIASLALMIAAFVTNENTKQTFLQIGETCALLTLVLVSSKVIWDLITAATYIFNKWEKRKNNNKQIDETVEEAAATTTVQDEKEQPLLLQIPQTADDNDMARSKNMKKSIDYFQDDDAIELAEKFVPKKKKLPDDDEGHSTMKKNEKEKVEQNDVQGQLAGNDEIDALFDELMLGGEEDAVTNALTDRNDGDDPLSPILGSSIVAIAEGGKNSAATKTRKKGKEGIGFDPFNDDSPARKKKKKKVEDAKSTPDDEEGQSEKKKPGSQESSGLDGKEEGEETVVKKKSTKEKTKEIDDDDEAIFSPLAKHSSPLQRKSEHKSSGSDNENKEAKKSKKKGEEGKKRKKKSKSSGAKLDDELL